MPICVKSEIGPLKRVLLQRPGRELEHLSPNTMGQLLFDDIPYLYGAQREHDCFAQILRDNGAEVVYLADLTAQVLAGDEELRRRFVEETIRRAGSTAMGYRGARSGLSRIYRAPRGRCRKPWRACSIRVCYPMSRDGSTAWYTPEPGS